MKNNNKNKQEEIDVVEVLRSVWGKRRFIGKVTAAFVLLGLMAALFGQVEYTATSVMVPQTGKSAPGGNLSGLAAMAGINLNAADQGDVLSPMVYPQVVASVPFQRELMHSAIVIGGHDDPVTILDYFTEPGYRKFSLFPFLKKYTLGLPGLLLKAIRGKREPAALPESMAAAVEVLTQKEYECMEILAEQISVRVDEKNGYISLSARMPEALSAAQAAAKAQALLQEYITRFKVQKAQAGLDFIEARYKEVKADFEAKQQALAAFQDANRDIVSALARTRESKLSNEYNLAFSIYSELARQREQASIKVKEETPVFTVVEPVTVPMEKSAPRRGFILAVSLFLGILAGAGLVLAGPFFAGIFGTAPDLKNIPED